MSESGNPSNPQPIGENKTADIKTQHAKPDLPLASGMSGPHYHITCRPEKNWWDDAKPYVEIAGVILLALYTFYTIKMYSANKLAADAAKTSADTSFMQLELAQRPWLALEAGAFIGPLTFDQNGAQVGFEATFRNSGNSPAVGIITAAEMQPSTVEPFVERERFCKEILGREPQFGHTVFPTDKVKEITSAHIRAQDMSKGIMTMWMARRRWPRLLSFVPLTARPSMLKLDTILQQYSLCIERTRPVPVCVSRSLLEKILLPIEWRLVSGRRELSTPGKKRL